MVSTGLAHWAPEPYTTVAGRKALHGLTNMNWLYRDLPSHIRADGSIYISSRPYTDHIVLCFEEAGQLLGARVIMLEHLHHEGRNYLCTQNRDLQIWICLPFACASRLTECLRQCYRILHTVKSNPGIFFITKSNKWQQNSGPVFVVFTDVII